jgi:hypothetical protein
MDINDPSTSKPAVRDASIRFTPSSTAEEV